MNLQWLGELDLDPASPWLRMGTRGLGERPWLVTDENTERELELRTNLMDERPDEVVAEPSASHAAAAELEQLVIGAGVAVADGPSPLRRLGASIQEDLCLLERTEAGWILRAAVLCFPSRWRLGTKLDRPLAAVHGPVEGYATALDAGVTKLIDRLEDRVVLRRNWFLHPDGALFQPDRPEHDPVVPADRCGTDLFVRSERQTLRLLRSSGWCVFTIRIQQCTVADLARSRRADLQRWLDHVPPSDRNHRGVPDEQAHELSGWLAANP
ncbi:MAG: DUF3445 domain-containing protein [Acidimicrobiales bacterium]|nr:DUF3445 domain-containing protein [Acidimicrobiales bacterium]